MFLSDFITVALIPTLINTTSTDESNRQSRPVLTAPFNSRALHNSRQLHLPTFSEEHSDLFQDDFFNVKGNSPSPRRVRNRVPLDPILREIYEEEKRLDLAGSGEDFDMRSEEAKELIESQRRKYQRETEELKRRMSAVTERVSDIPIARSLPFPGGDNFNERVAQSRQGRFEQSGVTQYPIFIPSSTPGNVATSTAAPPSVGKLGIGGVFGKMKNKIDSAVGSIKGIFGGSSNSGHTTTTMSPPMYFPDEDQENSYYPFPEPTPPPYYPGSAYNPNSIVFQETPVPSTVGTTRAPTAAELNCTEVQTVYDGKCYNVLQQLPCPPGQWLIENDVTEKGKCVENKCAHKKNTAFFGGECVEARSRSGGHCHRGMVPYVFKNGDVECDCDYMHLFNMKDGNCYPVYERGPCNAGEIFTVRITTKGTLPASCVKNKCSKEGFFCNAPSCPKDRNCIKMKSACDNGGVWDIHPTKFTPSCVELEIHGQPNRIIGNVPTLACAPGSRRDILGTCRKPSKISFS